VARNTRLLSSFNGGASRFPQAPSAGPLRGQAPPAPERDARLRAFRVAAGAFWLACVVFLLVPAHGKPPTRFQGGQPAQPKYSPARGL
jgi:hypothetical protein